MADSDAEGPILASRCPNGCDRRHSRGWLIAAGLVAAIRIIHAVPQSTADTLAGSGVVRVDSVSVPLNPAHLSQTQIGDFTYAGGLALTSRDTDQLHGLSDLEITGTDRLIAVSDLGVWFSARLMFDGREQLIGVTDARLTPLVGEDGTALAAKADADAEGLAQLANGDRLVSFERRHRILLYPAGGGPPRPAPSPAVAFPLNGGMEALAADPASGADVYVVGAELAGDTWTCRLSAPRCSRGPAVHKPKEFGLVALRRLPRMQTAYLLRAFDTRRGSRISLQIVRANRRVARMTMAQPMTVDNFEGLAAVPRADGSVRFYLLSDDNGSATQRTLLLAFDWRPR
jgi:hypothetical protein